ncbi:MAG TPA: MmcQ/YjbR family DNA-binding protein [Candidatus Polarisedimenticolia bacterium]|nr:MmcQ/YjbR family DNA-binding protein [Candidatus Polarisedimenticolia bacterium]
MAGASFQTVRRIALALPGVEDSISYGTPSLKVKGKFLARLKEDGETLAIRVEFPVRDAVMQEDPEVFFITDHYANYPAVLVRLPRVKAPALKRLVEHAWRTVAPKRLVRDFDALTPPGAPRSGRGRRRGGPAGRRSAARPRMTERARRRRTR